MAFAERYEQKLKRNFNFWYVIFLIIKRFKISADKFSSEALEYAKYDGFYKMMENQKLPDKKFSPKRIASFIVDTYQINLKYSDDYINIICNEFLELVESSKLSLNKKNEISSAKNNFRLFFELLVDAAYDVSQKDDFDSVCVDCSKLSSISAKLHKYAHTLRDEYYLLPILSNVHQYPRAQKLNAIITDHLNSLSEIIKDATGHETLTVVETLIYENIKNGTPSEMRINLPYKLEELDLLPLAHAPKTIPYSKSQRPLNNLPEYSEIIKNYATFFGPGNDDNTPLIIVPIRINSLITPESIDKLKKQPDKSRYENLKDTINNPSPKDPHEYDIRGFISVYIYGYITKEKFEFCKEIAKFFGDSIYKNIERINHLKIV